jgi:CHAD domain-containing protein
MKQNSSNGSRARRAGILGGMASGPTSSVGARLTNVHRDGDAKGVATVGGALATGALAVELAGDGVSSREDPRRFRLREGELAADGIRRIACGQLDLSIERLDGGNDEDLGTAVHEARKSFKRLRATVRLARDELGDEVYRRENTAFRNAGRRLAGTRDSQVLLETLEALSERYPNEAPRAGFLGFESMLADEHAAAQQRLQVGSAAAAVLSELRHARQRVPTWPLEGEALATLAPGLRRIYRRGRGAYRTARRDTTDENLHELRKRVKDLWYAAQILRPASTKRMRRVAREAHKLSDVIGEEHDLTMLEDRARERRDRFGHDRMVDELAALIERRRRELQQEALRIGARLYRKKPRKVARPVAKASSSS